MDLIRLLTMSLVESSNSIKKLQKVKMQSQNWDRLRGVNNIL